MPQWRWAAGRYAQLAPVWKNYKIGVWRRRKVIVGVTVRDVSHTEASYVARSATATSARSSSTRSEGETWQPY